MKEEEVTSGSLQEEVATKKSCPGPAVYCNRFRLESDDATGVSESLRFIHPPSYWQDHVLTFFVPSDASQSPFASSGFGIWSH